MVYTGLQSAEAGVKGGVAETCLVDDGPQVDSKVCNSPSLPVADSLQAPTLGLTTRKPSIHSGHKLSKPQ